MEKPRGHPDSVPPEQILFLSFMFILTVLPNLPSPYSSRNLIITFILVSFISLGKLKHILLVVTTFSMVMMFTSVQ